MSPDELAAKLLEIKHRDHHDIERDHGDADDLLVKALRELGYGPEMLIYESIDKWYS